LKDASFDYDIPAGFCAVIISIPKEIPFDAGHCVLASAVGVFLSHNERVKGHVSAKPSASRVGSVNSLPK
jgi:hypothetical protein